MRGFLVGSLALVVLYVVLQPNAANSAASASGVLTGGLKRVLSGDVAGIPDHSSKRMLGKKLTPGSTTTPTPTPSGVWT